MERPGQEGDGLAGSVKPPTAEAQLAIASAIGALEALVEVVRARFALVFTLEQCSALTFVAPALASLVGRAVENDLVTFDPVNFRTAERMMHAPAFGVRLGEDDAVASDLVDGADMFVVATDHFHVLTDMAKQAALAVPLLTPAGEVIFEARLVLAAVIVIITVEVA